MKPIIKLLEMIPNNISIILLVLIWSCKHSNEKETSDHSNHTVIDDYSSKIDSLIETTEPRIFNGVVLITKGGETKYVKEYGYSDIENKTPISIDDRFRIMSNSKQVTAVLIMREVENGRINLQEPISKYLNHLNQTWADTVTVHQLLNMSKIR